MFSTPFSWWCAFGRTRCFLLFAILVPLAGGQTGRLENEAGSLTVMDGHIRLERNGETLIETLAIRFNHHSPLRWRLEAATADTLRYTLRFPASVEFDHAATDDAERTTELTITASKTGFRIFAAPEWGRQVTLEATARSDRFFGLSAPLQPGNLLSPDLTGASITVDIASEGETYVENYASAFSSFYLSSAGYGAFFDTFARGRYDFAINGLNRIHHDTGTLDWHLFLGEDATAIHQAYYAVIGAPKKVPLWALGPMGWRDQNDGGAAEILDDIGQFSERRMPFSAWWVDRPYSDGAHEWSRMNFNPKFAQPEVWIRRIREEFGLEFMTWSATATFGDQRFAEHLPGRFSYLDLSDAATVEDFQAVLAREQYRHGVKGHKIDRSDEGFPVTEAWSDGTPQAERRNRYVYLTMKTHHEALAEAWGDDQVTFARAAIHRTQPYLTAIWGGDARSTWNGLRGNFANAARSSLMGFPVWGTDVGGYLGEGRIPADLYLRWLQAGSMTGLFEIKFDGAGGAGLDRLPWNYDEAFVERFRAVLEDRWSLMPYLYTLANRTATQGPMMQPMVYRHLADRKTHDLWDQFYVGDILVAPIFSPENERAVYLPAGRWRDFDDWTQRFEGGQTIEIVASLDRLPRFIEENRLYLTGQLPLGNAAKRADYEPSYTLRVLPGQSGESATYEYLDPLADDAVKKFTLQRMGPLLFLAGPALGLPTVVEIHAPKPPAEMGADWTHDPATETLRVPFAAETPIDVRLMIP